MTMNYRRNYRPRKLTVRTSLTGLAAGLLACVLIPTAAAAAPQGPPPEPEGGISQGDLDASIKVWDISENIIELGQSADEDDVLVLETDLLFAAMEWELPSQAESRISSLVEDIPEGASVDVHGHTDSNPVPEGYDFDNQDLSENRAQAVAELLERERPDLDLSVEGFGDSEPAMAEDPDDPSTYAANRRVEIRYGE
ncbi:OmpA family protein [Nesterenkonia massiliensis]|uniref:OmpA family protein n=1 Tax=Nesterenkonia massiliensis TaxID=1232429 RepID=A0ABT2HMH8_9MICC|nr:OmpA family protein [Nesterenkonia massiliensis]MCT1605882.1 OmpA family protein [Nesterenkonia massiliensis]